MWSSSILLSLNHDLFAILDIDAFDGVGYLYALEVVPEPIVVVHSDISDTYVLANPSGVADDGGSLWAVAECEVAGGHVVGKY